MNSDELKKLFRRIQDYLQPPVMSKGPQDTLREVLASQLIKDKLDKQLGSDLMILDVGCGDGVILDVLKIKFENDMHRIVYHGIDQNPQYIEKLTHEELSKKTKWQVQPRFTSCAILDYREKSKEFYDIIFVLNFIHEFDPVNIPHLLEKLSSMLKINGVISIFDMEELPKNEKEVKAICFNCKEIENILRDMGVEDKPINQERSVGSFYLNIKKFKCDIGGGKCLQTIQNLLKEKLDIAMDDYKRKLVSTFRWDYDDIYEWIYLTGHVCRLNKCLQDIELKLKEIGDK